jgi:hypothetical protein
VRRAQTPTGYLQEQSERALLEGRCYQRRDVLGSPHLRALLQPIGASERVPVYLLASLARQLPLYPSFRARVIAEVHPKVDRYEAHSVALRALALVHAMPPLARR